jgi:transcriptional regulator with XRE-family HTH domain
VEPHQQFAANLRARRLSAGLTQEALGHLCGLHPTEVSRLERATREPRLSTIVKLARSLDLSAADLLRDVR